jgi:hypothetical protein
LTGEPYDGKLSRTVRREVSLTRAPTLLTGAVIPTSNAIGLHFYPIWEAASLDEWLYNGGPYQLIVCHFLLGVYCYMGFSFVAQQKGDFLFKKTDSTRPLINNWWWGLFSFAILFFSVFKTKEVF